MIALLVAMQLAQWNAAKLHTEAPPDTFKAYIGLQICVAIAIRAHHSEPLKTAFFKAREECHKADLAYRTLILRDAFNYPDSRPHAGNLADQAADVILRQAMPNFEKAWREDPRKQDR